MEGSRELLCECESTSCTLTVQIPIEIAREVDQKGYVIIAKGCRKGPNPTDKLIRREATYAIYQESEK